jgi:hypothetical protein
VNGYSIFLEGYSLTVMPGKRKDENVQATQTTNQKTTSCDNLRTAVFITNQKSGI